MPAGRPVDPTRRDRVLQALADHVVAEGMDDLNLRALAAAVRTSPRMLLYDFGTKEALVAAVVEEVRRRQGELVARVYDSRSSSRDTVRAFWEWLIQPQHAGWVRLYAQLRLRGAVHPGTGFPASAPELLDRTEMSRSDLVVIVTLLHGLALRRLGDDDPAVVDAAFEHFLATVRDS